MITITEKAIAKIHEISGSSPDNEGKDLRIFVSGVGCSGYSYGLAFDQATDEDTVVDCGGLTVLVDKSHASILEGAAVDFLETDSGSGFTVTGPKAPEDCSSGGCCGC